MIGFPSVGKSTLLSTITKTESAQASYEFTTLTCIPGVIEYKNANIQVCSYVSCFTTGKKYRHQSSRTLKLLVYEVLPLFPQLLDLPGIIEGAAQGKGRGRQVIAVARTADLVLMILDATKKDVHRQLLEAELDSVGIRLNQRPPNIYFKARMAAVSSNLQF